MKNIYPKRKIKVCHIIAKMVYGGASIGTLHLAEKLDPEIFDCTIIYGSQSENEGRLLDNNIRKEVHYIALSEMVREINLIKDYQTILKLVTIIRKNHYDIVHTHGSKAGVIGRIAAAVARVPAILYTVHGWGLKAGNFFTRTIFRLIEKLVASFTTMLLFQTSSDMEEAASFNIGVKKQYYFIGNGVDLNRFLSYDKERSQKIRSNFKLGKNKIIGSVGRVSYQKNPYGFVNIAKAVLKRRRDVIFLYIGGGELLDDVRTTIKRNHLSDNIIFAGVRDYIPEIIANFDIFILPSRWEGMPRSLIEAMIMAKPVIVSKIDGINEIVQHGKNGYLVSPDNINEFSNLINYTLNNGDISLELGNNAKKTAQKYDFANVIAVTEHIYRQSVEEGYKIN